MQNIHLHGKSINLRILNYSDAQLTLEWRNSERAKLLGKSAKFVEEQQAWIKSRPLEEFNFIIELAESKKPVGMISLINHNKENGVAESARFLIGEPKSASGLPVAVESMLLLYQFAFRELNLWRVYGFIAEENLRMIKWQKYLGMKEEGRWREHLLINGKRQDAVLFGILKSEFDNTVESKMIQLIKLGIH